jgi:organic hydroperoxide reductase OsmC/OhrA
MVIDMEGRFDVTLDRMDGYRFEVDFGDEGGTTLQMDEPEPIGDASGPNAARVLAGAIGNCLSASLLFCLEKSRIDVVDVHTTVTGTLVRNDRGRLRLGSLRVRLEPKVTTVAPPRLARCLEIFEDFCIVTQSVRDGLDVAVDVAVDAPVEAELASVEAGDE